MLWPFTQVVAVTGVCYKVLNKPVKLKQLTLWRRSFPAGSCVRSASLTAHFGTWVGVRPLSGLTASTHCRVYSDT